MIRFTVDGDSGPGYALVAEAEYQLCRSDQLTDSRSIALQARALADAAAALIESLPEWEKAFEALHDALSELPTEGG